MSKGYSQKIAAHRLTGFSCQLEQPHVSMRSLATTQVQSDASWLLRTGTEALNICRDFISDLLITVRSIYVRKQFGGPFVRGVGTQISKDSTGSCFSFGLLDKCHGFCLSTKEFSVINRGMAFWNDKTKLSDDARVNREIR